MNTSALHDPHSFQFFKVSFFLAHFLFLVYFFCCEDGPAKRRLEYRKALVGVISGQKKLLNLKGR